MGSRYLTTQDAPPVQKSHTHTHTHTHTNVNYLAYANGTLNTAVKLLDLSL